MHLDTDAYLAVGGFISVLVITIGLVTFLLAKRR